MESFANIIARQTIEEILESKDAASVNPEEIVTTFTGYTIAFHIPTTNELTINKIKE